MKTIYYAIQNIIRGKDSTLVKVVSLSLGLFLSIILFALVGSQFNYDSFYREYKDIYVVETALDEGKGWEKQRLYGFYPTAKTLVEHFPEQVEAATAITPFAQKYLKHGNENHQVELLLADSLFFQTMGIPLLEGNVQDLSQPDALFLSQSTARRIFNGEEAMGKTVLWQNKHQLIVKGIFADIPQNVTLPTEAVLSDAHPWMKMRTNWTSGDAYPTFVRLKKGADMAYINERINPIIENYLASTDNATKARLSITPLKGYHMKDKDVRDMVAIELLLGLMLLLTAAFNYALITISSLTQRAKAIGVHKCSGAEARNIFGMLFWETLCMTVLSILLVLFLILNFHEKIEELTDTPLEILFSPDNLWAPGIAIVILFVIGCILPGRLFSTIPVTQVFRRYTEGKKRWKYPLLFTQFVSAAFIMGVVAVIYTQHHYVMHKDMGYDSNRVVYLNHKYESFPNLKTNLRNLPYVEGTEHALHNLINYVGILRFKTSDNKEMSTRKIQCNKDFCELMNVRLKAGKYHSNPNEILVNSAFVKKMGWTSDGVGEVIEGIGTVTGVTDMHRINVVEEYPCILQWMPEDLTGQVVQTHIRLKEPFEENLNRLQEDMKHIYPDRKANFRSYKSFMDEYFHDARIFRDSVIMACIAILAITLMGVIGYTNDEVRRRSKEIAIRKVNGAEVGNILRMLCRDVAIIALPAVLIGTVASKYVAEFWVSSNFNDILPTNPILYIGVVIVALAFILGTVIVKSWRVANENPVLSIKNE